MKLDTLIIALVIALIMLAVILLAMTCRMGREVEQIRRTVELYEQMNRMLYDSLEDRIEAIEEALK